MKALQWILIATTLRLLVSCNSTSFKNNGLGEVQIYARLQEIDSLIEIEKYDRAESLLFDEFNMGFIDSKTEDSILIYWHTLLGNFYYNRGMYESAITNYEDARELVTSIDSDLEHRLYDYLANCYGTLTDVSNQGGLYVDYFTKADTNKLSKEQIAYMNYRHAYFNQSFHKNCDGAQQLVNRAIRLDPDNESLRLKCAIVLIKCNASYSLNEKIKELELVVRRYPEADYFSKSELFNLLGDYHWNLMNYQQTLTYSIKSYEVTQGRKNSRSKKLSLGTCLVNLADAYMNLGDYDKALKYLDSADLYSPHMTLGTKQAFYWNRMEVYHRLGYPLDSSYEVFHDMSNRIAGQLIDKSHTEMHVLNHQRQEYLSAIQEKYRLENEKFVIQRNYLLALVLIAVVVGLLVILYQRKQAQLELIQHRLTAAQLNPHFLGNVLYSTMLMVEDEVPEAYVYLSRLGGIMRHLFTNYQKDFVPLHKELQMLSDYLTIEQDRLDPGEMEYSIEVGDTVSDQNITIPPMLIQPVLENAVKYRSSKHTNNITLSFELIDDKLLLCRISDTGRGIDNAIDSFPKNHSLYYIKKLTDRFSNRPGLILKPNQTGTGTTAELILSYR